MRYSFESPVRFSEVDENAVMTIPALVDYFQDAASLQAEALGIGTAYLAAQKRGWLLLSWQIVIDRLPGIAEQVCSTTWGYSFRHMLANRNFTLTGGNGELCAWANSQWMLFDFANRMPVTVPENERVLYDPEEKLEMEYVSEKIRPIEGVVPERHESFHVDMHHLDTNHHVNNGQYIKMAMSMVPDVKQIRQMRAQYLRQALLGDEISPVVYRKDRTVMISLNSSEGEPYCLVELTIRDEKTV